MDATWQRLGDAAGTKDVGLNRVRVAPGKLPTPPHSHGASEEVYYVLARLRARVAGRPGARGPARRLRHPPRQRARAHVHRRPRRPRLPRLRHAASDGFRLAAPLGRRPASAGRGWRAGPTTRGTARPRGRRSRTASPPQRPPNILNIDEVELERWGAATTAPLATKERSDQAGFHWERLDPGGRGSVPHCHSEEEEIFVILEGEGTLHLWPSPSFAAGTGAEKEEIPIRPGHVIARPPGDARQPLVPGRRGRPDDADLRHAQAERHVPCIRARTRSPGAGSA